MTKKASLLKAFTKILAVIYIIIGLIFVIGGASETSRFYYVRL